MTDQAETIVGDPELITRVRAGDPDAYAELYRRHATAATNLARQFARGSAEVDDLVSESFAKVLGGLRSGKGPYTAFRAYLFTTLRHTAYDRTRKDVKLSFTDDQATFDVPVSDPDTVLLSAENKLVGRAYEALPERWQAVLWYLSVEGYSPAKTGELLGLTANAVTSLAFRAREGLRESYLQAHLADTQADECRTMVGRLGAWTRDGLSKRERAQVDAHLRTCDDCRALAAELIEVNSELRVLLAPVLLGGAAAGYLALLGPATTMVKIGALTVGGKALIGAGAGGAAAGGATAGGATATGAAAGGAAHGGGVVLWLTKIPKSILAGGAAAAAALAALIVIVVASGSGPVPPAADHSSPVATTVSSGGPHSTANTAGDGAGNGGSGANGQGSNTGNGQGNSATNGQGSNGQGSHAANGQGGNGQGSKAANGQGSKAANGQVSNGGNGGNGQGRGGGNGGNRNGGNGRSGNGNNGTNGNGPGGLTNPSIPGGVPPIGSTMSSAPTSAGSSNDANNPSSGNGNGGGGKSGGNNPGGGGTSTSPSQLLNPSLPTTPTTPTAPTTNQPTRPTAPTPPTTTGPITPALPTRTTPSGPPTTSKPPTTSTTSTSSTSPPPQDPVGFGGTGTATVNLRANLVTIAVPLKNKNADATQVTVSASGPKNALTWDAAAIGNGGQGLRATHAFLTASGAACDGHSCRVPTGTATLTITMKIRVHDSELLELNGLTVTVSLDQRTTKVTIPTDAVTPAELTLGTPSLHDFNLVAGTAKATVNIGNRGDVPTTLPALGAANGSIFRCDPSSCSIPEIAAHTEDATTVTLHFDPSIVLPKLGAARLTLTGPGVASQNAKVPDLIPKLTASGPVSAGGINPNLTLTAEFPAAVINAAVRFEQPADAVLLLSGSSCATSGGVKSCHASREGNSSTWATTVIGSALPNAVHTAIPVRIGSTSLAIPIAITSRNPGDPIQLTGQLASYAVGASGPLTCLSTSSCLIGKQTFAAPAKASGPATWAEFTVLLPVSDPALSVKLNLAERPMRAVVNHQAYDITALSPVADGAALAATVEIDPRILNTNTSNTIWLEVPGLTVALPLSTVGWSLRARQ